MNKGNRLVSWLDERVQIVDMWDWAFAHLVPRRLNPLDLMGAATLFAFVNQAVTGILLAMYYNASATTAYSSIQNIMTNVPSGWIIRNLHYWGANAMVVLVAIHMLRGFYVGAYKRPRELTWITGCVLLLITILFAFTGYLLPWDQQSYWATVVGTAMATYAPFIGSYLQELARGGTFVTGVTLTRFYSVHMLVLPAALMAFLGAHLFMVLKRKMLVVEEAEKVPKAEHKTKLVPFWPYTALQGLLVVFAVGVVILLLALNANAPLVSPADPLNKDLYQPKPLWYFYSIYYILELPTHVPFLQPYDKMLDPIEIIGLPAVAGLILVLLPWIDRAKEVAAKARKGIVTVGLVVAAATVYLTYLGATAPLPGQVQNTGVVAKPSFSQNIQPILSAGCYVCHAGAHPSSGFNYATYQSLMSYGIVKKGDAADSILYKKLTGALQPRMPLGGQELPKNVIQTIANWINEGAPNN